MRKDQETPTLKSRIVVWCQKTLGRIFLKFGFLIARHRGQTGPTLLAYFCEYYLNSYKNRSYDRKKNGEERLVSLLELQPGDVIFDVGAHEGEYARQLKKQYLQAEIHCFEISSTNAERFRQNNENTKADLILHEIGLGAKEGKFPLSVFPFESQIVSLHRIEGSHEGPVADVLRADKFCMTHEIKKIAFLKIDTEGNDLEVLKGFGEMLNPTNISVIQFEYNECSIDSGVFLKEFFRLLEPRGYILGKIFPRAVEFGPYATYLEDHRASNFCAVGKDSDLIVRLAGKS